MANEILAAIVIFIIIIVILLCISSVRIIQPYEQGLLFVLGKYKGLMNPGFNLAPPLISQIVKYDLRPQNLMIPHQNILTRDGKRFTKQITIRFRITEPKELHYKTTDFQTELLRISTKIIKDEISQLNYDEIC